MLKHNFELGARRRDLNWPVVVINVVAIAVLVAAVMPKISRHSEVVLLLNRSANSNHTDGRSLYLWTFSEGCDRSKHSVARRCRHIHGE